MILSGVFYFSIFLISSILLEITYKLKKNKYGERIAYNMLILLSLLIPSFFAGIRYGIGTDYFNYVTIFNDSIRGFNLRTEFGYILVNMVVNKFGGSVNLLFFIISFLTLYFVYRFLKYYQNDISVGLGFFIFLLQYYNLSFNAVRQVLAISICLLAFKYIDIKKWPYFFCLALLGTTIHVGTIAIIPFYFVYNNVGGENKFYRFFVYCLVTLAIANYQPIIEFISTNILKNPYYLRYAIDGTVDFGFGVFANFAPQILIGMLFYNYLNKTNSSFRFFYFLLIIGFLLKLIAYFGAPHLNRLGDYFGIVSVWLIPYYFRFFINKKLYFWISFTLITYSILLWAFFYIYVGNAETVPYTTIFN